MKNDTFPVPKHALAHDSTSTNHQATDSSNHDFKKPQSVDDASLADIQTQKNPTSDERKESPSDSADSSEGSRDAGSGAQDCHKDFSGKRKEVIADYNGYDYKKIFWEDADRAYEDMADRIAIRRLLPMKMDRFADIAGGYGRLADEYLPRANTAILFDYSETELAQAREKYGQILQTQAGDIYNLPFDDNSLDALMMVRATHHFNDMQKVSDELYRVLKPGGIAVIEVANKKTLPKIFRYWSKKSEINPFSLEPAHLRDLNAGGFYNYHPKYIEALFKKSGFQVDNILSVSNFRSSTLKKLLGTKTLINLERPAQKLLAPVRFAPSIYYRLVK